MPGTVLSDDWRRNVEDQLREHATNLVQGAQDAQRKAQQSLQDIQGQLTSYANSLQAPVQFGPAQQPTQPQAPQQSPFQILTDYANQLGSQTLQFGQPQQREQPQTLQPVQQQQYGQLNTSYGQQPSLSHSEEPGTYTDQRGGDLGGRWKTQFDFGATYTGDYRTGTPHRGIDLVPSGGGGIGTEVDAFAPGTVTNISRDSGAGGLMVYVQDDQGLTHAYMHLADVQPGLAVGQRVQRGQPIAKMGESGTEGSPHLHYEVRKNASVGDPLDQLIDPRPYLGGGGGQQQGPVQRAVGGLVDVAREAARKVGIDPDLFVRQIQQESGFDPNARSPAGATGIAQFMPDTARGLGIDPSDPIQALNGAASYMRSLVDKYGGNVAKALAAYNAGPGAVDKYGGVPPYQETQRYVDTILGGKQAAPLGTAGQQPDEGPNKWPVTVVGDQTRPLAREPLYMQTMQPAGGTRTGTDQGGLEIAGVQQESNPLAAQLQAVQNQVDDLRRQLEQYNQPPLAEGAAPRRAIEEAAGGIGGAVGGFFSDVGRGAQGAAQDFAQSGLGNQVLRGGMSPQEFLDYRQKRDEELTRLINEQRTAEPLEMTPQNILGGAARMAFENPPSQGPSLAEYQQRQTAIGQGIKANNPLREVPFVGGLTSQAAEFAMSGQWVLPFGTLTRMGEGALAAAGAGRLASRVGAEAVANAVQNALYEVTTRTDATPQSVGEAFLSGGILGAGMPIGAEGARRIGAAILAHRAEIGDLLRTRQPAQAQVGFAMGAGPGRDVLHGQAVPRPGYEPGTPEATVEDVLSAAARRQGTARPDLTQAEIQALPGLSGSRTRSLREVRDAIEAGLPAARWYSEIVQQVRQDTGTDINPREAAVLMGAFGGNAGVPPNYHAMLSVFDAMRQAKPDLTGLESLDVPRIMETQPFKDVQALMAADKTYADWTMLARVMRGYRTGEIPVPSGAKLSSYTQNFLHALNDLYDPYSTQDVWQGRLFGSRLQSAARGADVIPGTPDVAGNDQAYRSMHALTNWLAREFNISPREAQAAGWSVFRTLWNDPVIGPGLRTDATGLSDAIRQGHASGVLHPPTMATAGLGEVTAPRGTSTWGDKIHDVRDRIRQNGSYNAPPPDSATALNEWGLYHPSIQSAAQQRAFLDPSGFQYGKVVGPKTGVRREVGNAPAAALRDLAIGDAPMLRVAGEIADLDPQTGRIRWLLPEHDVQRAGAHTYVSVVGVGDDAAQLIGRRLGADLYNHADPTSSGHGGVSIDGLPGQREQAALAQALQAQGIPVIREQVGTGLRVPLLEGKVAALTQRVQRALANEGISGATLVAYTGETHAVQSAGSGRTGRIGRAARAVGSLGVPPGNDVRGQQLAASLFRDAPIPSGPGAVPPGTGIRGRQRAEAYPGFGINLLGGATGAWAGNVATPEDAALDERLRNIGLGATAGLLGTAAITRGRGGTRLAEAVAGRTGRPAEGFRAPERPGSQILAATTQEPPGGPGGAREPRRIEDVRTNPYGLREAREGETPMSTDDMLAYADELEQRLEEIQNQRDAVDEMLRNPTQKVKRPPWAAGYTNVQLAEIARRHNISPYDEAWWDTVGLESGSGEVRYDVGESGLRGAPSKPELSPTELRAERKRLAQEEADVTAAYEQMSTAPADATLVRGEVTPGARGELPFDEPLGTRADEPSEPAAVRDAMGGRDEGARLAQEIVLGKGRGRLTSTVSEVTGEAGGIKGRAILSAEGAAEILGTEPSAETKRLMPNLDALLGEDMQNVAAQIRKSAEDNPDLMAAYRQGRITLESLRNDMAQRVGMTKADWLKTPVGKAFNPEEMVALQAASVEAMGRLDDMGESIVNRGGVDNLSDPELVFALAEFTDAQRLLAVARGGRSTASRSLNALKQRFNRQLASEITASNERIAAKRVAKEAKKAATKATAKLKKGIDLEREAGEARTSAREKQAPRNILEQIDEAYAQLDRYNAMSLHEKADVQDALKAERAKRAAERKARVRSAPEELLKALQDELKAEQKIFAGRRDNWETQAFWETKANEIATEKRNGFRGQLYIEQQRKIANIAAKDAEREQTRAFDKELRSRKNEQEKAERMLAAVGGREVTRSLLSEFIKARRDPDPMAAAKFLKGTIQPQWWQRANIIRIAGLVSAPITHMINVGGNTANAMVEIGAVRPMVVGIDALRSALNIEGEVGRQAYRAELLPMLQAYGPGVLGSLGDVQRVLKTGVSPVEMQDLSRVRMGLNINGPVDAALEMPLRALTAEDVAFRGGATSAHAMRVAMREATALGMKGAQAKSYAARLIANLEEHPHLAEEVASEAARMVFQERRSIPFVGGQQVGTRAQREAGQFASSQVMPFVRTPTNITAQGIAMSPVGYSGALQAARAARHMPTGTAAERAARGRQVLLVEERLARATVGSLLFGAGLAAGAAGMLTAAYPEDEKVASTLPQGWRPWSLRLEDPVTQNTYYVPLQNLGPMGLPLAMASIATASSHKNKTIADDEQIGLAAAGIGRYVLDNTFLQGLSDFVDAVKDPARYGQKFGESLVASYGPYSSMGREIQRAFGVASRNPREGFRGLVDAWLADYPVASGTVPPSLTPLGEERTQGATGIGRYIPLRYDIERDEPTLAVLRANGVGIPQQQKAVNVGNGWSIDLTEDERAQLQQQRGAAIRDQVLQLRGTDLWRSVEARGEAGIGDRNALLRQAVSNATQNTNNAFVRQLPQADLQGRAERRTVPEPYLLGGAA